MITLFGSTVIDPLGPLETPEQTAAGAMRLIVSHHTAFLAEWEKQREAYPHDDDFACAVGITESAGTFTYKIAPRTTRVAAVARWKAGL